MKATERLFLNKNKTKVVGETDDDRASLLAAPGQDIPREYESMVKGKKDAGKSPQNKDAGAPDNKSDDDSKKK